MSNPQPRLVSPIFIVQLILIPVNMPGILFCFNPGQICNIVWTAPLNTRVAHPDLGVWIESGPVFEKRADACFENKVILNFFLKDLLKLFNYYSQMRLEDFRLRD